MAKDNTNLLSYMYTHPYAHIYIHMHMYTHAQIHARIYIMHLYILYIRMKDIHTEREAYVYA